MSDTAFAKCPCQACAVHLEFPLEAAGARIVCPQCGQETELTVTPIEAAVPAPVSEASQLTVETLNASFPQGLSRTRVSFLYQAGLAVVALTMVVLPLVYLAMIAAAGWAVYVWATHFSFLLTSGGRARVWLFKLLCYIAPLFAGSVLLFFMIKPLFARRPAHAQPLALNPEAEPLLFTFIARVCEAVGAPFPRRIDLDCNLNAAASYRRGLWSLFGNDLVLTIGLPLVGGLNLRQFAGVLAHEFGHFTQGFGMRLTYVIRTVNGWFFRVAYERDAWDVTLEEWAQTDDWRVSVVVNLARLAVWFSRLLLKVLMYFGHVIGCFMLRQMEYDADSYQFKLAGSPAFEDTMRRCHVLGNLLEPTYKNLRVPWNLNRHLPDNFPAYLFGHDANLTPDQRTHLEDTMGLEPTGLFDTHPSNGDRIRRARQANEPGIFHLDAPASALFTNFEVVSKQVTLLHYGDDLGLPLEMAKLMPVTRASANADETEPVSESAPPPGAAPRLKFTPRA